MIGGQLTLAGRELQFSKSWQLSVGAVEDLVTRLRLRAAVDLSTWKAYPRVGFRTERLTPINIMEGFTLQKQVPLDGPGGHVRLQVKANFALPEPEIEYSTETQRSLVGMGDIELQIAGQQPFAILIGVQAFEAIVGLVVVKAKQISKEQFAE